MERAKLPDIRCNRRSRPRILAAAEQLAATEQKAGPLTMEAIASAAGVTRRTLYNHFANLTELCMAASEPLFAHCAAVLPPLEADMRPIRMRLHALAVDVLGFQRDPLHGRLKAMVELQSGAIPSLAEAYRQRVSLPLRRLVATRLALPLHAAGTGTADAGDLLATLDAVERLDYFIADLSARGSNAIVVDLLVDRVGGSLPQRFAA
ncbi:TetR/AcrR family transcriptional regulator [Novosphingobium soli]|uniref:TetR/AcrR family transcriptional regulator n=1 Tax=Novosphingobium soli TaxID=574956 RepID=A0ABV6CRU4_9SPHN